MKSEVFKSLILFLIILFSFITFVSAVQIQLDAFKIDELTLLIRTWKGLPGPPSYYYSFGGSGGVSIDSLNHICYYSNFTTNPTVSGKKMLSASYVGLGPGAETSAFFASCGDDRVLYWQGTDWQWASSCGLTFLKLSPASEYIICDVTYTDFCTPLTCSYYPLPQCGTLSDGCSGTISCNMGIAHTSCSSGALVCASSWGNCDGNWANGCEVDLSTSSNCGSCGSVCGSYSSCNGISCVCSSGWGNCDGNFANGCEVNLSTSSNCGSCGSVCGSYSSCNGISCVCSSGWGNCDGNFANGCEVNLSTSSNCGSCGNVCGLHSSCNGISCVCSSGWGNCDGNFTNGCETPLGTNSNCASCGNICTTPDTCFLGSCCGSNVSCLALLPGCGSFNDGCGGSISCNLNIFQTSCISGSLFCNTSWANCDSLWNNGCEVNLSTSSNCGSCGSVCGLYSSCTSGSCVCASGRANCDGNFANGCEIDLSTNSNCGSCGNVCGLNSSCNSGSCICSSGFSNCDGNFANGCEIQLGTLNNCESCGDNCFTRFGVSGQCINNSCVDTGFDYWADMSGNKLDNNHEVEIGEYVKLVSSTLPPYNIDDLFEINEAYWIVNTSGSDGSLFFRSSHGESENQIVPVNSSNDSPLDVQILEPHCGEYTQIGNIGSIKILVNDSDDFVFGNISISKNSVDLIFFNNINNGSLIEFNYTFNESGNLKISVDAINSKGKKFKSISNIMVVDNSPSGSEIQYYVSSCIDEPRNYEGFNTSLIRFNASSSHALKYTKSTNNFEIIPSQQLFFNWSFYAGKNHQVLTPCLGIGTASCPYDTSGTVTYFKRNFPKVSDNYVSLSVSIPDSLMV